MGYYEEPKRQAPISKPSQKRQARGNPFMQTSSGSLPPLRQGPPAVSAGAAGAGGEVQRQAAPAFAGLPQDLAQSAFRPDCFAVPAQPVQAKGALDSDAAESGARSGLISTAALATKLTAAQQRRPAARASSLSVKARLPTAASITSLMASGSVPEDKVKESIETALTRMHMEGRLETSDPVPDIMARLFPSAGVFDEAEFAKIVSKDADTARTQVYENASDAQTKLNSFDKPKLLAVIDDAKKLVGNAAANSAGLTQVFGAAKAGKAKFVYVKAAAEMSAFKTTIDTSISTDYNRDDEEIGLGGWASFSDKHIHLTTEVAKVTDKNDATITIVHEFCHMADASVDDLGYYGSPGFEAMSEDDKVANAAHYEELPARELGVSSFAGQTFTPGVVAGGGAMTFEDEVRREASEYLRKAWDKAVDVHIFLRGIRQELDAGSDVRFQAKKARIIEISQLEKLTIHHQMPTPTTINMNDIVLGEGVARGTGTIQGKADAQPVPAAPVPPRTQTFYANEVIKGAIQAYGALTGNYTDDKALMDWLVAEYQKPL